MIAVITGSRSIIDEAPVRQVLNEGWARFGPIHVLHQGGAAGVDRLAKQIAEEKGIFSPTWDALWDLQGKAAGGIRSINMVRYSGAEYGLVVWDGVSRGTQMAVEAMRDHRLPFVGLLVPDNKIEVWRP